MKGITPYLWFDNNVEEAIDFYTSIFKNATVKSVSRQGDGGPVMSATFELEGQTFMALNGGPQFTFTEAVSFFVSCENQQEVDDLWEKLSDGGEKGQCGWLKDKFGLSWQVVPTALGELMGGDNAEGVQRVVQAMLKMKKLDIKTLEQAYEQG